MDEGHDVFPVGSVHRDSFENIFGGQIQCHYLYRSSGVNDIGFEMSVSIYYTRERS